jgi:putative DNA methylase
MAVPALIERWFPAPAIGAESLRDASAAKKPPNSRLHVWWARRPLSASRAAVIASLLPAWPTEDDLATNPDSTQVLAVLRNEFPTGEEEYQAWFLRTLGIFGDPVAGRRLIAEAKLTGRKLDGNGYGYKRAFTT